MQKTEFKTVCAVKLKSDNGVIAGYPAAYNNVDYHNDVIVKGAFNKSLAAWKKLGKRIPILWQHDFKQVIGSADPDDFTEDEDGLYVVGKLTLGVKQADEARLLIKDGALGGLSIGYQVVSAERKTDVSGKMHRYITEINLLEFSPVTWPANENAVVTVMKSAFSDAMEMQDKRDELWNRRWNIDKAMWDVCLDSIINGNGEEVDATVDEAAAAWKQWFKDYAQLYQEEISSEGEEKAALLKELFELSSLETKSGRALSSSDAKAGRVLSAANLEKVQAAYDALGELLAAAKSQQTDENSQQFDEGSQQSDECNLQVDNDSQQSAVSQKSAADTQADPAMNVLVQELRKIDAFRQFKAALRSRR